jgi:competence protein ComEA
LPFGSRVIDAIQKAQPRPDADLNALNLADFLEDGQEVTVPSKNRFANTSTLALPQPTTSLSPSQAKRSTKPQPKIVHLNSATEADLVQLPGIGPALAKRIIEYRRQIGGFKSVEQLLEVRGIGEKKLEQIRPYVRP